MTEKIVVPKEENTTLNGMQKIMYCTTETGNFTTQNYGSEIEEFATKTAVEEYELLQEESYKKVQAGISSPIEYFMYKNRMDLATLASVVGMFEFRVKRHLSMKVFLKMNDKLLQKYAEIFDVSIKELKGLCYEK